MRTAVALAMVLTVTGCPFGDDDGDPSNYVSIYDVKSAYQDAYCQYLVRCGVFPEQAACVGANVPISFSLDPNLVAAVAAGHVIYNGNNIKACFDALAQRSCDKTSQSARTSPPECRYFVRGTLAAGEACIIDEECISQECTGGEADVSCTMGTCIGDTPPSKLPVAIGQSCASAWCVDGAYCDTSTLECTALLASGAPCSFSGDCGYGLGCVGYPGARTCKPLPTLNEPCPDFVCRDDGQYCASATGTCAKVGLPPTACTSSTQCSLYYPCDFTAGTCKQGPGVNQSCSGSNMCFTKGTFCDSSTLTCVEVRPIGGNCTNDTQCQSEFCDFNTGLCAAPPTCF